MSAPRIRTSGPKLGPVQLSSFSLPKYLLIAMFGALMTALLACGADTESGSGQSSVGAAPAATAVPTDGPTAAQVAAPATPTDTLVPAVVSEPTLTLTTTDASPQAMPTDTPAPTHTAATPAPEPTPVPKRGGRLVLVVGEWPANWDTEAGKKAFLGESGAWEVIHEERGDPRIGGERHIMVEPSRGYESDRGGPYLYGIHIVVASPAAAPPYPIGVIAGIQSGNIQGHFGPMMMKDEVAAQIIGQTVWSPRIRVHTWGDRVSDEELVLAVETGNWFSLDEVPTTLMDCRVRGYQSTDLPQSLDDWIHVWFDEESSCVSDEEAGVFYTPSGKATRKPQAVSDQPVAILTPGIALGEEVWWWRPQHDDYTPPAVLENHPHRRQLLHLHSPNAWTLMLEQVVAVLREANPISADEEAEAIARMTKIGFVNGWGWEIADANESLVMYWSTVRWGNKEHRVGALVRYNSSGEPEGFVQASPKPVFGPEPDLEGIWYAKKQTGETSSAGTYENHPYGLQLDLMDGRLNHHPELDGQMNRTLSRVANEYYTERAHTTVQFVIADKIDEHMNHGTRKRAKTAEDFVKTAGWEITHIERAEVRYWGTVQGLQIGSTPAPEYRVGFTVQWETDQPIPPLMGDQVGGTNTGSYPIENFLDHPKLAGEVIVEPVQ